MTPERPPHVDRQWWYRASWKARQSAVDAHQRRIRTATEDAAAAEAAHIARLRANVEREKAAHEKRYYREPKAAPAKPRLPQGFMRRDERVALIESLLQPGYTAESILAEMGCKVSTAIRACEREGRLDLAALFRPLERDRRRGECKHCGAAVSRKSERCRRCAQLAGHNVRRAS